MEEKFGVSVADQLRIEAYLDSLDDVVPLKIDVEIFSKHWTWYWSVYVKDTREGRAPELAVQDNGLDIYSLFSRSRKWLTPLGSVGGPPGPGKTRAA